MMTFTGPRASYPNSTGNVAEPVCVLAKGFVMTAEENRSDQQPARPRPTRAQRIVAAGFLGAFSLTIITVLLTGLWVRSPTRRGAEAPPAAIETNERSVAAPAEAPPAEPASQHETPDGRATESTEAERTGEPHEPANEDAASERAPADGR
jgi:hypothetical protein